MMTEQLTQQEYTHFLAYGDPVSQDTVAQYLTQQTDNHSHLDELEWISTLESTTHEGMTFGYATTPCMYTAV